MRQTVWFMVILVAAICGLHAMKLRQACLLSGRIFPSVPVTKVLAAGKKDTIQTVLKDGAFELALKPGIYTIIIDVKTPYRTVMIRNVVVDEGENKHLGEIKLKSL